MATTAPESSAQHAVGIPLSASELKEANRKKQAYQVAVRKRIQEIGIKEKDFYYIAERSLTTPLPDNWVEAATEDGYIYYFNEKTEESVWHHPLLNKFKEQYERAVVLATQQANIQSAKKGNEGNAEIIKDNAMSTGATTPLSTVDENSRPAGS